MTFDNDQDYLEARSETLLRNTPGGAEALDGRLRAEVGIRREVRAENGKQFEVEIRPDGSEWLLGKVGEGRSGIGMMLRPPAGDKPGDGLGLPASGVHDGTGAGPQPSGQEQAQAPEQDGMGAGGVAMDVARGVFHGLNQGVEELLKTLRLDGVAQWMDQNVADTRIQYDLPQTEPGKIVAPVAQALPAAIPAARVLSGLSRLGAVGHALQGTLAGATADFTAFSPEDDGLGELAKDLGTLDQPTLEAIRGAIEETLAKGEDDGELEKRLKNVGGGVLVGGAIDAARGLFRAAKHLDPDILRRVAAVAGGGAAAAPSEAEAGGKGQAVRGLVSHLADTIDRLRGRPRGAGAKGQPGWKIPRTEMEREVPVVPVERRYGEDYAKARDAFLRTDRAGIAAGGPYRNADTGWEIGVSNSELRHAIGNERDSAGTVRRAAERIEAAANLPKLLEAAVLIESRAAEKKADRYKAIHRMIAPMQIGDEVMAVKLTVREVKDGVAELEDIEVQRFYDLALEKRMPAGISTQPGATGVDQAPSPTAGTTINLRTLLKGVKFDDGSHVAAAAAAAPGAKDFIAAGVETMGGGEDQPQDEKKPGRDMTVEDLRAEEEATGRVHVAGAWTEGLKRVMTIAAKRGERELVERSGRYVTIRPPETADEAAFLQKMGVAPGSGVDFNFDHIASTDDLKGAIDAASEVFAKDIDKAKRGVIAHDVTKDMAEQLDMSAEVLTRRNGQLWNAEQMLAARQLLVSSAKRLDDIAQHVKAGTVAPGFASIDETALAFRRQMAFHAAVQAQVKGAQTEIARALSSFRIDAQDTALRDRRVQEMLQQAGGLDDTRRMAEDYLAIDTQAGRNKFASGGWYAKSRDAFFEVWINGLLSNPKTHIVNVTGNALFSLWQVPERALAGAIGKARTAITGSDDRVYMQEALAQLYGVRQGFGEGLRLAAKAFRNEEPTDPLGKLEARRRRAISADALEASGALGKGIDYMGAAIRMPGRFLMAEDEFFKAVGYRMELHALAYRRMAQAMDNGMSENDAADMVANLLRNPPAELKASAEDAARYMTFTKDLESDAMRHVQGLARTPVGKVIMPFVRTPANILKTGLFERSPLAVANPQLWKDLKAGGARADMAMARVSLGSTMVAWSASLAMEGHITGGGPVDPAEREVWLKTHQPYSVKIGDQWYAYGRAEPLAMLFGYTANLVETFKYDVDDKTKDKAALLLVTKVADTLKDKTFFTGVADFAEAMAEPDRFLSTYMARQAGSLGQPVYSSLIRGLVRADDPTIKDTRPDPNDDWGLQQLDILMNGMRSAVGATGDMPAVLDIFGEQRKSQSDDWWEMFSPVDVRKVEEDRVVDELIALGMPISKPDRKIGAVDLSPQQYHDYVKLAGKDVKIEGHDFHGALEVLFASPEYIGLMPAQKRKQVERIYDSYKDVARAELAKRHPDLAPKLLVDKLLQQVR